MPNGAGILFARVNKSVRSCKRCGQRKTCHQLWGVDHASISELVCQGCESKVMPPDAALVPARSIEAIMRYGTEKYAAGRDAGHVERARILAEAIDPEAIKT